MGLICDVSNGDYGLPDSTPILGIYIDYSEGWQQFANAFLESAYADVPVDTGNLLNSIDAEPRDDGCTCRADAEYAQYVEFGTWKMDAQPYFIPALYAAEDVASPLWEDALNAALEEEEAELAAMEAEEAFNSSRGGGSYRESENKEGIATGAATLVGSFIGALIMAVVNVFINEFIVYHDDDTYSIGTNINYSSSVDVGSASGVAEQNVEIT